MPRASRLLLLLASCLMPLASSLLPAHADGEAGLVIQHGDGSIDTYCVPFAGDSISGADILKSRNISYVQTQGLVCAVGNNPAEGCFDASSYESCTCKCTSANNCSYWAFFTQAKGSGRWLYSALGFFDQRAKDGDLQAWKWGKGGPNSAPAPPLVTFEQVCGHAPRGGLKEEPTATPTIVPPTAAATLLPVTAVPTAPAPQQTAAPSASASAGATTPATIATPPGATASPEAGTATAAPPPVTAATTVAPPPAAFTITAHGTATAAPPATGEPGAGDGGGGGKVGAAAFAAVAMALLAAIGGAALLRRRGRGQ